jgi:hypothetical protein
MSNGLKLPQYELLYDGRANIIHMRRRGELLGSPLRGDARNRVYRLTADMRATEGQVAFGHIIQTVTPYSNELRTFYYRNHWTYLDNAR